MGKPKKGRHKAKKGHSDATLNCHATIRVDRIDLADRFEEDCAKAVGIASLMMEADADVAVQNAAWVVRDLVEKIRSIGRIALKIPVDESNERLD